MTAHLTPGQLERYQAKSLTPAELLDAGDHLASCAKCRAMLESALPEWRREPVRHLTYEELTSPHDSWAVEHLRHCPLCQADLASLRKPPRRQWWLAIPALAAAAGLLFVLIPSKQTEPLPVLAIPADLAQLRPRSGVLLGDSNAAAMQLTAPVATFVASARPRFQWTPVDGALRYEIEVYDANFERVAAGSAGGATEWTPASDLIRGPTLSWRVTAILPGRQVSAPVPPAPEARFRILDADSASRWQTLQSQFANEPRRLAILAANLGLRQEAIALLDNAAPESRAILDALRW